MVSGVLTMVLRMGILLLTYPIYLSFLGNERYGIWIVLATVIGFSHLGELGIGEALTKFVAEECGRHNIAEASRYVMSSQVLLCASGLILFAIVVVLREQIVNLFGLSGDSRTVALGVLPYIGALSIYVFVVHMATATLSGLGRMDLANYIELLGRIIALGLSVFMLWMNWGIMALVASNAISYVFIHVASVLLAWRIAGLAPFPKAGVSITACRRLIRYGTGVLGITVLSMLSDPLNKIMVTRYVGLSSVVLYEIATKTGGQIKALFNPALRALMPEVSRLGAAQTGDGLIRIRKVNRRVAKLLLLGAGSIYVVLLLFARPILRLWLRQAFQEALPTTFRIVLTASFVSLLGGIAYHTVMGLGRVRLGLFAHILKAGVNVAVVVLALFLWRPLTVPVIASASLAASVTATLYLLVKARSVVLHLNRASTMPLMPLHAQEAVR